MKTNEWKLGLFVVSGVGLAFFALAWLGASQLERDSFESHVFFDESVDGLELGSPVKFRGVTIGQVQNITTAGDRRHVKVTTKIYKDELERLNLPTSAPDLAAQEEDTGLRVQLVSSALTGVSFLQGDFFDPDRYPVPEYDFEVPPNTIHTAPSALKSIETNLVGAMKSIPGLVQQAGRMLARIERAIDDIQFREVSGQAVRVMTALETRLNGLEEIPVIKEGEIAMIEAQEAMRDVRALVADLRSTSGPIQTLTDRYEGLGEQLTATIDAADLPATTASLRRSGDSVSDASARVGLLASEVRADLVYLREALDAIRQLADTLERDPGALVHGKSPQTVPEER